jgi:hypothetical protein
MSSGFHRQCQPSDHWPIGPPWIHKRAGLGPAASRGLSRNHGTAAVSGGGRAALELGDPRGVLGVDPRQHRDHARLGALGDVAGERLGRVKQGVADADRDVAVAGGGGRDPVVGAVAGADAPALATADRRGEQRHVSGVVGGVDDRVLAREVELLGIDERRRQRQRLAVAVDRGELGQDQLAVDPLPAGEGDPLARGREPRRLHLGARRRGQHPALAAGHVDQLEADVVDPVGAERRRLGDHRAAVGGEIPAEPEVVVAKLVGGGRRQRPAALARLVVGEHPRLLGGDPVVPVAHRHLGVAEQRRAALRARLGLGALLVAGDAGQHRGEDHQDVGAGGEAVVEDPERLIGERRRLAAARGQKPDLRPRLALGAGQRPVRDERQAPVAPEPRRPVRDLADGQLPRLLAAVEIDAPEIGDVLGLVASQPGDLDREPGAAG